MGTNLLEGSVSLTRYAGRDGVCYQVTGVERDKVTSNPNVDAMGIQYVNITEAEMLRVVAAFLRSKGRIYRFRKWMGI